MLCDVIKITRTVGLPTIGQFCGPGLMKKTKLKIKYYPVPFLTRY